ncbi:Zinc finger protein ZIC 5 [Cytospora mali]|uniref:Zinc finger protein ZIC 5 n=1 Tax=Cytospora mali TaxID=578113 RepID=A0A194V5K2_CYTMA|nr:Zinc finger protein ZIC 5 [Valsa mali var. pyri (nom. inval.)]
MSSNASGTFPFSQTGPSDPTGSVWDAATVEGPQNFFADQGDAEEYSFTLGHFTAGRNQTDATDDFQATWMPAAGGAGDRTHKAEPMRRISSRGSAHGHRITKTSSNKSRPRLQTTMSQGASRASKFDMTGNACTFQEGPLGHGRMMDVSQYIFQQSAGLTSPEMTGSAFYPQMDGLPVNGMAFGDFAVSQHVDPGAIPLDFDTSISGGSPSHSWDNLSEGTSPSKDDVWPLALHSSPLTSVSSHSPTIQSLDNFSLSGPVTQPMMAPEDIDGSMMTVVDEQVSLVGWNGRQPVSEGETARDHPLYKNAYPKPDGLFHCPWEGQANCNHKPEKLKCNYDKFVDSHLKPYRCKVDSCENARFSSTACLLRHEREAHAMHGHGDKPYLCTYEGCDRAVPGNGFPRNWNLRDHMRRVHNDNGSSLSTRSGPPSPGGNGHKEAKSRKRKSDPVAKSSSGRKSPKSNPIVDVEVPAREDISLKLRGEWAEYQGSLSSFLTPFPQADDPMVLDHINALKDRLDAMARIHKDLVAHDNSGLVQQQYNPFAQQSG